MIIRTHHTANFTINPNSIINDASLSGTARAILLYLLSKPAHWRFNARDIVHNFGIGINKVYKLMRELINAGYAYYVRGQSRVEWSIFDRKQGETAPTATTIPTTAATQETAQPCGSSHRDDFNRDENHRVLERTQKAERENNNPAQDQPAPIVSKPVVVSLEETTQPQPMAVEIPPAIQQSIPQPAQGLVGTLLATIEPSKVVEVSNAYGAAIEKGTVKNPVGYLRSLINAVQNGTFSAPTIAKSGPVELTLEQRLAKQKAARDEDDHRARSVDNVQYFKDLYKRLGPNCLNAIPKEFHAAILSP